MTPSAEAAALEVVGRAGVAKGDQWNLGKLFDSPEAFEVGLAGFKQRISEADAWKEGFGAGVDGVVDALIYSQEMGLLDERLGYYAFLRSSEDAGDSANQDRTGRYTAIASHFQAAFSYFEPTLQGLDDTVIEAVRADERVQDFGIYLDRLFRFRPHMLGAAEERILAMQSESAQTPYKAFSALSDVDASFGTVDTADGPRTLTHGTYGSFMESDDRSLRQQAYTQMLAFYGEHKNVFTALYNGNVQQNVFRARVRYFDSARGASLFQDDVPAGVYDGLIEAVRDALPQVHRYYALRGKVLGLDDFSIYDTRVPLVKDLKVRHTWDEAVSVMCDSLAPLGSDYVDTLREGLLAGWADRYEKKGKRSGAFSAGSYVGDPYILMNFDENQFGDVFTLTHEAGHSMHSWNSVRNNPYPHYQYTIFVAEVASTFNEQLLMDHFVKTRGDDPTFRAYLVNRQIDQILGTIVRQTMFAEFERDMHARVEEGGSLTVDALVAHYGELQAAYFGPDVRMADETAFEALRIPHFYSAFYVYKYATGLAASMSLAQGVLDQEDGALERYLGFLKSGGNAFPIDQLKAAGVDMSGREAVDAAMARFGSLVDQLDQVLG